MSISEDAPPPDSMVSTERGVEYWQGIDSNVNGMLGGVLTTMPSVARIDLQGSRTFLARLGIGNKSGRKVISRALEGGAGIGRVTEGLLLPLAEQVDVIEPIAKFTNVLVGKPGVGEIFNVGLREWQPPAGVLYDLIWTQWCVGHVNDESLVRYLEQCKTVLNPEGGVIVIKENLSTRGTDEFDELDGSVTRGNDKFQQLFSQAGLQLIKSDMQRGFPAVGGQQLLLPVKMYALKAQPSVTI